LERYQTSGQQIELFANVTGVNPSIKSLDEWFSHFGIECTIRHQAAADTFATAELLMRLWPYLAKETNSWASLRDIGPHANWIPR
jgi:DNA polymerase-3 subunit epsilon